MFDESGALRRTALRISTHDEDVTDWISTKKAMKLLGVGSTTIKRWADDGRLPYYRTAGGHRRFSRSAVCRIARGETALGSDAWTVDTNHWLKCLMGRDLSVIVAEIHKLPQEYGDWFSSADFLGRVIQEIGQSWANNDCSVIEEHILSMKLIQAMSAVVASLPVGEQAPTCLVAAPTNEPHGLGALLAQLCLRSQGANAIILGTNVPIDLLNDHLEVASPKLLALSASTWQTDAVSLGRDADLIAATCRKKNIELVLGGDGAWPDNVGHRCRSFAEFKYVLARTGFGERSPATQFDEH